MRRFLTVVLLLIACAVAGYAFQRQRLPFLADDEEEEPTPTDADEKTEWVFARLRYNSFRGGAGYWGVRGRWSTDYPKAERHFVQGLRRLTRLHVRSVETVVDLDSDEIFQYPWIYGVEVGHWDLNETQAKKMREYLLRGGFLMVDDFHGSIEWEIFMASLRRVFPDRPVVDVPIGDKSNHTLYDVKERPQIPGIVMFYTGKTYEQDGIEPAYRGVYDDSGRLMVAICHNMDLGDAWEHADLPQYPENYTSMAYRIGVNYILYAMTH
jgi:hypothetical protein